MAEKIMNMSEHPEVWKAVKDIMTYLRGLNQKQGMSEENCLIAVTIASKMMEDIAGMTVRAEACDVRGMDKEEMVNAIAKMLESILGKKK